MESTRAVPLADKTGFIRHYVAEVAPPFNVLLLPLLAGAYVAFRRRKDFFWMTFLIIACNGFGLIFLLHFPFTPERVSIVRVYYLPSFAVAAVWLGLGLRAAADALDRLPARAVIRRCLAAVLLLSLGVTFAGSLRANNRRNDFLAYDYGKNILSFLPKNSLLFIENAGDESLFATLFLHAVMGVRGDVQAVDCFGNVFTNIYGDDIALMTDKAAWLERRKRIENLRIAVAAVPVNYLTFAPEGVVALGRRNGLITPLALPGSAATADPWALYNLRGLGNMRQEEYQEREIAGVYRYFRGSDLLRRGRAGEGYAYYGESARQAGDVQWLMNQIGLAFYRQGLPARAADTFSALLSRYPGSSIDWYNLGLACLQLQRRDDALKSFTRATALDAGDRDSFREIADLLWEDGRKDEAGEILRSKLRGNRAFAESYVRKGADFYQKKQPARAIEEWRKALLVDPEMAMAQYNLGVVYGEQHQYDKARRALQDFLRLRPDGQLSRAVRDSLRAWGDD